MREPTEMELRVAEALYLSTRKIHQPESEKSWDRYTQDNRQSAEEFLMHACAAIRAMRAFAFKQERINQFYARRFLQVMKANDDKHRAALDEILKTGPGPALFVGKK